MKYNPANWYWIVGGSTTQVYSSARAVYVATSDATYVAWLAAGGKPTAIDTAANLQAVLEAQYPAGWPSTLAQQAATLLANGLAVTSTGTPSINATYATDAASIQKLIGIELGLAAGQGFPEGAPTFPLRTVSGTPPLLTPTQYTAIAALIRNFAAQAELVIDGLSTTLPSNEPPPIA